MNLNPCVFKEPRIIHRVWKTSVLEESLGGNSVISKIESLEQSFPVNKLI